MKHRFAISVDAQTISLNTFEVLHIAITCRRRAPRNGRRAKTAAFGLPRVANESVCIDASSISGTSNSARMNIARKPNQIPFDKGWLPFRTMVSGETKDVTRFWPS
jgi:hypothetical protein